MIRATAVAAFAALVATSCASLPKWGSHAVRCSDYVQIQDGMTLQEVVDLMGWPGVQDATSGGAESRRWVAGGADSYQHLPGPRGTIFVTFYEGRVASKSQYAVCADG